MFALVASVALLLILICIGAHYPKHKNIASTDAPISIELMPNDQVNIMQARSKASYTKREFNNMQQRLKACFERKLACKFVTSNAPGCQYTAWARNVKLCLNESKLIVNATIDTIILHRGRLAANL